MWTVARVRSSIAAVGARSMQARQKAIIGASSRARRRRRRGKNWRREERDDRIALRVVTAEEHGGERYESDSEEDAGGVCRCHTTPVRVKTAWSMTDRGGRRQPCMKSPATIEWPVKAWRTRWRRTSLRQCSGGLVNPPGVRGEVGGGWSRRKRSKTEVTMSRIFLVSCRQKEGPTLTKEKMCSI